MPEQKNVKMYVANKAVLVNPAGQVLIMCDAGKMTDHAMARGYWDFPGGRMQFGETPLEGLQREVKEETGIEIDPRKARLFHSTFWTVGGETSKGQILGMFYIVPVGQVEVKLSIEHSEYRWVNPRLPLPEGVRGSAVGVLEKYKETEKILAMDESLRGFQGFGLIQVIYGSGKGKTTAALGQAMRCVGSGRKVAMIFFDKGGENHYSERALLESIPQIDYWATGRDRIDPVTNKFDFTVTDMDRLEATHGLNLAREALTCGKYDLVVLDEINPAIDLGILRLSDVLSVIDNKNTIVELILTGRNPHEEMLKRAHLVTNVQLEKHYFYSGVPAREGLDF